MIKYLIPFIILYVYFYALQIFIFIRKKEKFDRILEKFSKTSKELPGFNGSIYDYQNSKIVSEIRAIICKNLMSEMPLINDLLPYSNIYSFSLSRTDYEIIDSYDRFLSTLISKYDELMYRKYSCLNPISPLQEIFLLPSRILSWFGLTLDTIKARIFSVIIFIFGFVIKFYGKDIFDWVLSFFN